MKRNAVNPYGKESLVIMPILTLSPRTILRSLAEGSKSNVGPPVKFLIVYCMLIKTHISVFKLLPENYK